MDSCGEFEVIGDVECDIFGGGIEVGFEDGVVIQVGVMKRIDDLVEDVFEGVEVHHDADGVEGGGGDGDTGTPVVAVKGLKRVIVEAELVGGGEGAFGGDFEGHEPQFSGGSGGW
jgi:hypothetical protein